MDMVETAHKVNAEFMNARLWQMLILFNDCLQAATCKLHISRGFIFILDTISIHIL